MKKVIFILVISSFLCGCGENEPLKEEKAPVEVAEKPEVAEPAPKEEKSQETQTTKPVEEKVVVTAQVPQPVVKDQPESVSAAEPVSEPELDAVESVSEPEPEPEPPPAPPDPDDLRRIGGIGPKIADVLYAAGILTFSRLAEMSVDELKQVVKAGGVRIAYPDTWPEQAALAAKADWSGLTEFQSELQGGRRRDS